MTGAVTLIDEVVNFSQKTINETAPYSIKFDIVHFAIICDTGRSVGDINRPAVTLIALLYH